MGACKTLTVTLKDYNPSITYTVFARPVNSNLAFGSIDSLTQVATSSIVKFTNLTSDYEYEVGVQKSCNGVLSTIEWRYPVDPLCPAIVNLTFNGTDTFTVTLPFATNSFEWRIDKKPWVFVASNNNVSRTVNFTAINAAYPNSYGTLADILHRMEVRVYCSAVSKGPALGLMYVFNPSAQVSVTLIENICENGIYRGQLLRLSMPVPDTGNTVETLRYNPPGPVSKDIASWTRVNGQTPEIDIELARVALNGFNKQVLIDPNPASRSASIDFIADTPPEGIVPLDTIPCGDYPAYYSIV